MNENEFHAFSEEINHLAGLLAKVGLHHIYFVVEYRRPDSDEIMRYKDTDKIAAYEHARYLFKEGFIIVGMYKEQNGKRIK